MICPFCKATGTTKYIENRENLITKYYFFHTTFEWSSRQLVNGEQILPGLTGTALELESLSDVRFDLEVTSEYTKDRYVGSAILSLKEGEQIVIVDLQ